MERKAVIFFSRGSRVPGRGGHYLILSNHPTSHVNGGATVLWSQWNPPCTPKSWLGSLQNDIQPRKLAWQWEKTPLLIGDASSDDGFSICDVSLRGCIWKEIPMFLWISILRYRFYQQSNDFSKIEEGPLDSLQPNTFHPKIPVPVRLEILLWTRINTFSPRSQPHLN